MNGGRLEVIVLETLPVSTAEAAEAATEAEAVSPDIMEELIAQRGVIS